MDSPIISALTWIPKGSANPFPKKYSNYDDEEEDNGEEIYDDEEISDAKKALELENDGEDEDEQVDSGKNKKKKMSKSKDEIINRYNFDDYDESDEEDEEEKGLKFINQAVKGLVFHEDGKKDPYLKDDDQDDLEDLEDIIIRPSDALLVTAVANESEYSHINIMVYEEENENLYVHHDIAIGSFPLCLAWMDQKPFGRDLEEKGNFIAVGSFDPVIEIWDLDVIDNMVPEVILGQDGKEKGLKKKKTSSNLHAHNDSVLSLSWNSQQRNILASGSADKTIKVWDITTQQCLNTFKQHKDKVQSIQWNPQEKTVLLSGSFDKYINILDIRMDASTSFKWAIKSDIEHVVWNPHNPKEFLVASEDGYIRCYDATKGSNSQALWSIQAHEASVQAFSVSLAHPGFFASGGSDNIIKLWSFDQKTQAPKTILEKSFNEEVFSLSFFSSSPYLLAVGSESNQPNIVNTRKFKSVQTTFNLKKQKSEDDEEDNEKPEKEPVLISHKQNKGDVQEDSDEEDDDNEDDEEEGEEEDESMQ